MTADSLPKTFYDAEKQLAFLIIGVPDDNQCVDVLVTDISRDAKHHNIWGEDHNTSDILNKISSGQYTVTEPS